ncbi:MAG TPA: B3/4 domain-containing protein [Solirubrobacterales bacterium]
MRAISDRIRGAQALQIRREPIPSAYRIFFRHIGLDPDTNRTPIEALIFRRIYEGGLYSNNRVEDALAVATLEVGVALQAFDADRIDGEVGLRRSLEGEGFEGRTAPLPSGTIVIADGQRPVGILFSRTAEGREPGKRTTRMLLIAIGVSGVPELALEEGLWVAASGLRA